METRKPRTILACSLLATLVGCSTHQVTYEQDTMTTTTSTFPVVEYQVEPVRHLLIDQGIPKTARIVVASFANIDDLTEVSSLGRYLSDFFVNQLVAYGYPVYDLEAQEQVLLMKQLGAVYRTREGHIQEGNFFQSRPVSELLAKGIRYVLTGTYTETQERVVVQARLIDLADARIASTVAMSMARENMIGELAARRPRPADPRLEVVGP